MKVYSKYRLELHWSSVEYGADDKVLLRGAYFTGPVLKDAAQLRDEDELTLDMTEQHKIIIPDYYQSVLRWKGTQYVEDTILLKEAYLKGKYVNSIEMLENSDWVLIDCREHEEKKHPFHLVYWAELQKREGVSKF